MFLGLKEKIVKNQKAVLRQLKQNFQVTQKMESSVAGRRRTATRHSAEDQALDQIAKEVS